MDEKRRSWMRWLPLTGLLAFVPLVVFRSKPPDLPDRGPAQAVRPAVRPDVASPDAPRPAPEEIAEARRRLMSADHPPAIKSDLESLAKWDPSGALQLAETLARDGRQSPSVRIYALHRAASLGVDRESAWLRDLAANEAVPEVRSTARMISGRGR